MNSSPGVDVAMTPDLAPDSGATASASLPCPFLPEMDPLMTWRNLNELRNGPVAELYVALLRYAQKLWQVDTTARSLLALDRAIFIRLSDDCPVLADWPTPYAALKWMLQRHDGSTFIGNPRRHYQHLATRVSGDDVNRKRWAAWACRYITRQTLPDLVADTRQNIREPDFDDIGNGLATYGIRGELDWWLAVSGQAPIIEPERWQAPTDSGLAGR